MSDCAVNVREPYQGCEDKTQQEMAVWMSLLTGEA